MPHPAIVDGTTSDETFRVVIAGGGVGGLEAALALGEAGQALDVTLLAPNAEFVERPMSVAEPFAAGHSARVPVATVAHDSGATLIVDSLSAVDPERHTVITEEGHQLPYDALLIAVGAEPYAAVPGAQLWTHDSSPEIMGGLLRDMEEGYSRRVAFVQPDAPCWPLPVYELAMMCARDAYGMNIDDAEVTVVIPERAPLIAFGEKAAAIVAAELTAARVATRGGAGPRIERHGHTLSLGNGEQLDVDRVVALPGLRGPSTKGLPRDADGFLIIDERGRVTGVPGVWAIGDGTNSRLKQGGLAAQHADLAARDILARALGHHAPEPQAPVLRGMLLTGESRLWLQRELGSEDAGEVADYALWWPPSKIAGSRLGDYLAFPAQVHAPGAHVVETIIPRHYPTPILEPPLAVR